MADLELFERMVKAKALYKKLDREQFESYLVKDKIYEECQNVENKFYNCLTNIHLNRILTSNMTATEKKFKCYNEILASNKIYVEKRKLTDLAFREYYDLDKRVHK